jgi:hypothetical protein
MTAPFLPEPEQIAAIGRWLGSNEVKRALSIYLPKLGGPPAARENQVADVAAALQVYGAVLGELQGVLSSPS